MLILLNLLFFQRYAPEFEAFRLGIQKCYKTIQDTVKNKNQFRFKGRSILFQILTSAQDAQAEHQGIHKVRKGTSFKGILTNIAIKSGDTTPERSRSGSKAFDVDKMKEVADILGDDGKPGFDLEEAKQQQKEKTEAMKRKRQKIDPKKSAKGGGGGGSKPKSKESITQFMMKTQLRGNEDEDKEKDKEKEKKRKEAEKKREERKKKQEAFQKRKSKASMGNDRLLQDKVFLMGLAEGGLGGFENSALEEDVAYEAQEALEFLNGREKFWDQLDLGSDKKKAENSKGACESFRWLM